MGELHRSEWDNTDVVPGLSCKAGKRSKKVFTARLRSNHANVAEFGTLI